MPALIMRPVIAAVWLVAATVHPAAAQLDNESGFPTTVFAEGEMSAEVSEGPLTAHIDVGVRPDIDPDFEVPVLTVFDGGRQVLEVAGIGSGFSFPTTEASIAEIDTANDSAEVYFASFSGGAHCCVEVIVVTVVNGEWTAIPVGDFDGGGGYLRDENGDGVAEIVTHDNRFLYRFGCYACSAAPLRILSVHGGAVADVSDATRFLPAHRDWLAFLEEGDPAERWSEPGYIAGWVAAKIRVGEGDEAWADLEANWDYSSDPGEEACLTSDDLEGCPQSERAVLSFPARLKLFLQRTGYMS